MARILISWTSDADRSLGLPARASAGAAGLDLKANLFPEDRQTGLRMAPGDFTLVPTGLRIAMPADHEAQIRPRSGLALRSGVTVLNSPGTIDSDYRGEIGVLLLNCGRVPVPITHGDRIAQLVIAKLASCEFQVVEDLAATGRGPGGFGSTGR